MLNVIYCAENTVSNHIQSLFSPLDLIIFSFSGYLEIDTGLFNGGQDFDISMDFRTDQLNALLLFIYSTQTEDYMLVIGHINTGDIHFKLWECTTN